jgi:hypothetical protein
VRGQALELGDQVGWARVRVLLVSAARILDDLLHPEEVHAASRLGVVEQREPARSVGPGRPGILLEDERHRWLEEHRLVRPHEQRPDDDALAMGVAATDGAGVAFPRSWDPASAAEHQHRGNRDGPRHRGPPHAERRTVPSH